MNGIELKKEEAAFCFNQAGLNISGLDEVIEKQFPHIGSKKENAKKTISTIFNNREILQKVENYVFNFRDIAKDARVELEALLLKLVELRNYYSHYVHNDTVKILSNGEKSLLERYYQIAIEETGSEKVRLEIIEGEKKLTDAGVLFLLCMFLKKSQANKLISSIVGQPRGKLFTYFSVRDGYKILPDMQKHFLLFTLVDHLSKQDKYIENLRQPYDIGKGLFFHRIASTFLNISGILNGMKFYTYQSNRLKEQRGELKPEKDCFTWEKPFGGNSYFEINGHKGVIGEDELKELCYALLAAQKDVRAVEGKITQFLKKFKNANNVQEVEEDGMLDREYFPANYFNQPEAGDIKKKILARLDKKLNPPPKKAGRAYDKIKEVLEFINTCLPADEKLKLKDYRRYLKMVRFWGREIGNIEREFRAKGWFKYIPSDFWRMNNLEDAYKLARTKNAGLFNKLKAVVEKMNEREFGKYQQINNIKDIANLRQLAKDFGVNWKEKNWQEYSGQIKKQITDRQKFTIMKQRVTAELKKKHGIENLNLRISIDSDKSRKAVLNRIAIPRGFVKKYILGWGGPEKVSKKTREAECKILILEKYEDLSKQFYEAKNYDKMTQINSLYEKNKLIAFMVIYLMEQLGLGLKGGKKLRELKETRVKYKISDKVTEDIAFSQYRSIVYAISRRYVDNIDNYKFPNEDKVKPILGKIDLIEKERLEFIKQILGFERCLFENNIIDKNNFNDTESHISFKEICDELIKKGYNKDTLTKLKDARNAALHGEIPGKTSFDEARLLINELKKR